MVGVIDVSSPDPRTSGGASAPTSWEILEALPTPTLCLDPEGGATRVNRAWVEFSGLGREASLGRGWLAPLSAHARQTAGSRLLHDLQGDAVTDQAEGLGDWVVTDTAGHGHWVEVRCRHLDHDGHAAHIVTMVDITDRKATEADLSRRVTHDVLTGLRSRDVFLAHVEELLQRPSTTGRFAVLFADLDAFKAVNDRHGHTVGDSILKVCGQRIASSVRANDDVARIGGDEFVLLCTGLNHPDEALVVASRLIRSFRTPVSVDASKIVVTLGISVGIAHAGATDHSAGQLIARADEAMYRAKRRGGNQIEVALPGPSQEPTEGAATAPRPKRRAR